MPLLDAKGNPTKRGGARPGAGRKPSQYPKRRILYLRCDDQEWEDFLMRIPHDTRSRFEYLKRVIIQDTEQTDLRKEIE